MKSVIEEAVKDLVQKAAKAAQHHEAMGFAQAALNLAHAYASWETTRRQNEEQK